LPKWQDRCYRALHELFSNYLFFVWLHAAVVKLTRESVYQKGKRYLQFYSIECTKNLIPCGRKTDKFTGSAIICFLQYFF